MNKYFLLFITLTFIHTKITKAQITVEIGGQYNDPQFLVEDVLLGSGISASNFSFMGDSIQIGVFESNTSNLGISSGVVLATGDLRLLNPEYNGVINGVNVEPDVEDPDLLNVANSVPGLIGQNFSVLNINDVAVLEFDFVATSDTLSFYYAFASREYNAYENTTFNDVFGFFISGPGISGPYYSPPEFPGGSINIAVVPNSSTELPITISSVNNNLNSEYYIDDPIGINDINGFTVPLEATTLVQCGETYRIRLAIADGSDSGLSSYIFLSPYSIYIPESFTPNDDGINDFLQIYGNNIVDFNLNVFDRWGSLIYSTNEISNFWDGTYQGKLVPTGIYPYKIDLHSKNASFCNKNGVINVIY